jgi:hypothetical protein
MSSASKHWLIDSSPPIRKLVCLTGKPDAARFYARSDSIWQPDTKQVVKVLKPFLRDYRTPEVRYLVRQIAI